MTDKSATRTFVLQEIGSELRARREPEHLYTAAAVGALGAVAWGVSTISTVARETLKTLPYWRHPAVAGAVACILISLSIWVKIQREANVYQDLRVKQVQLFKLLAEESGINLDELPEGLRDYKKRGPGYKYSGGILASSTLATVLFCLSIFFIQK